MELCPSAPRVTPRAESYRTLSNVTVRWAEEDVPCGPVRLHVRRVVEPAAAPILLLHGLGVGGAVWQAFGRRLSPAFAAVAPDLRGHGQSDKPPGGYSPQELAHDVALLAQATGGGAPLAVVGHSLGALVALALAAEHPATVSHLALIDPPLDPDRRNPDVPIVARLRHASAGALEAYLLASNPGSGEALAAALAVHFRQAADGPFDALLGAEPGHPWAWRAAASIPVPVLLVRGDPAHGGLLGLEAAERFTARLPHGTLLSIPGAGHSVHATHAAPLAHALLERLR